MSDGIFWLVTALIALGTFALRFGFHAVTGDAEPAPWLKRALETLPAAILAALTATLAFGGVVDGAAPLDPASTVGVLVSLLVGVTTRDFMRALLAGLAAGGATMLVVGIL